MTTVRWQIRVLEIAVATVFVGVAGWYSPLITAAGWHVFHPHGRIEYRGLRVLVPWPWTAESDPDPTVSPEGLGLKRMPFTMDRRLPVQAMFVTVISPDPGKTVAQQTDEWMEAFRATHPGAIFDNATLAPLPAGAHCLSAHSHWIPGQVVWTCISVEAGWVADFEGETSDAPSFFRIVTGLKR
jgi:hypothetical protein